MIRLKIFVIIASILDNTGNEFFFLFVSDPIPSVSTHVPGIKSLLINKRKERKTVKQPQKPLPFSLYAMVFNIRSFIMEKKSCQ